MIIIYMKRLCTLVYKNMFHEFYALIIHIQLTYIKLNRTANVNKKEKNTLLTKTIFQGKN